MVIIDDTYPNYESVSKKYNSLSKLVENLIEVQTQDSLQKLSLLSEEDLNKKIKGGLKLNRKSRKHLNQMKASKTFRQTIIEQTQAG
jgi:predicted CopG family antitoxin